MNQMPCIGVDERGLMMKKGASIVVCLACFLVLLTGSVTVVQQSSPLDFSFDNMDQYTGFNSLPSRYTLEMAQNAGYYVMNDSEVVANGSLWDGFLAASSQGKLPLCAWQSSIQSMKATHFLLTYSTRRVTTIYLIPVRRI